MRALFVVLASLSLVLSGCATGPDRGYGSSAGTSIDPRVAALACGVVGGVVGSRFGDGRGRVLAGLAGAAIGAGVCNWLASRGWDEIEPGQAECRSEGGRTVCVRNEPLPAEDQCVTLVQVQFAETGADAWRCELANGDIDYHPV